MGGLGLAHSSSKDSETPRFPQNLGEFVNPTEDKLLVKSTDTHYRWLWSWVEKMLLFLNFEHPWNPGVCLALRCNGLGLGVVKNQATEGSIVLTDMCTYSSHSQAQSSDGDEEAMSRTWADGIVNVDGRPRFLLWLLCSRSCAWWWRRWRRELREEFCSRSERFGSSSDINNTGMSMECCCCCCCCCGNAGSYLGRDLQMRWCRSISCCLGNLTEGQEMRQSSRL